MGENTAIEWCDHSFSPWWGCAKVSAACDNCYAEAWARRFGVGWGPFAERRPASENTWRQPLKWNAKAAKAGKRARVFCASMADVFDVRAPEGSRERLWSLIDATPHLIWMLLTKRPQNVQRFMPAHLIAARNVWIGATVENQEAADLRHDHLRALSMAGATTFVSYEPALSPVDWAPWPFLDLLISGGESGPKARPSHPDWHRATRDFCAANGIAYHFKQWGEWVPITIAEDENGDFDAAYPMDGCSDWEAHKDGQECLFWQGARLVHWPLIETREAIGVRRVGKKAAGRLLDGRTHDDMPRTDQ